MIVAAGGPVTALAAKNATATIPIVFTTVADPVKSGLVASLNRPGGNVTGTAGLTSELDPKRLELLHRSSRWRRSACSSTRTARRGRPDGSTRKARREIGRTVAVLEPAPRTTSMSRSRHSARGQSAHCRHRRPALNFRRAQVLELAARHKIPAIYQWREFGARRPDELRRKHCRGVSTGWHLCRPDSQGRQVGDLPVLQPTRFEFVINLQAAKALGLAPPDC